MESPNGHIVEEDESGIDQSLDEIMKDPGLLGAASLKFMIFFVSLSLQLLAQMKFAETTKEVTVEGEKGVFSVISHLKIPLSVSLTRNSLPQVLPLTLSTLFFFFFFFFFAPKSPPFLLSSRFVLFQL